MEFWFSVGCIFVLLLFSAFFSGAETAMTAASRARLHAWEKEGDKRAGLANKIRERKDRVIGAMLLGNNVVNILSASLATSVLIKIFGDAGVAYATVVMTVLVIIFSEVLPKTYALHHADKMSVALIYPIKAVVWLFAPFAATINWIVRFILKLLGQDISKVSAGSHMEVLRGVIDLHKGEEQEIHDQRAMLRSVLDLADVEIGEIMIHRKNVTMLDVSDSVDKLVDEVLHSPYTRLPVYNAETDDILGVLHAKALLRELRANKGAHDHIDITALASDPWYVPETTTLYDQLQAFRSRREHFALVVDEYGTFKGIVTLEDILEEIVGEIDDEHDVAVSGVRRQAGGGLMVDGTVTIRDLNREFDWNLPDENYSTLAGLIIHEAKAVPEAGQSFTFYDLRFDIVKRQRNQLTLIRITPPRREDKVA